MTYVNLRFVQMMTFEYFKERALKQDVEKIGDISEADLLAISESTRTFPFPVEPQKRADWQAILLLIRPDLQIDLT